MWYKKTAVYTNHGNMSWPICTISAGKGSN